MAIAAILNAPMYTANKIMAVAHGVLALPEFLYVILFFGWMIRGYYGLDLIIPLIAFWASIRFLLFGNLSSLLACGLPLLAAYLYLILKDFVFIGSIRPLIVYAAIGFLIVLTILSTSNVDDALDRVDARISYAIIVILMWLMVLFNYYTQTEAQILFAQSVNGHGRFFLADSFNPIWVGYLAAMSLGLLLFGGWIISSVSLVLFAFAYMLSRNEAQFISVLIIFGYYLVSAFINRSVRYQIPLLLGFAVLGVAFFVGDMIDWVNNDPSASGRSVLIEQAMNQLSFIGDPRLVFYVDIPLIEMMLEFGFLSPAILIAIFYFVAKLFLLLPQSNLTSFAGPALGSICVFTIAQVHYRPFDYSFLLPLSIALFWFTFLKKRAL
jgi:hypothetical protein